MRKEDAYDLRRTEFQKFLSQREKSRKTHQSSDPPDKQPLAQTCSSKIRFFDTFNSSQGQLTGSGVSAVPPRKSPQAASCKKQDIYPEQTHKVAAADGR